MQLKKLIVHGFKSFADRTVFAFEQPITGIVGPNGCGKSNVVDAVKWVLGEQSAKSLRGDAMMDVIFNGSQTRKPAGMAEVTLVFGNPRRPDGTRLLGIDVDEVSVGRRLFRDGTSEYQLNGQTTRLKDIRELFLDTGVGVDAYSVIEQGRVAALLEANPEERRQIFEEAAGISKFKIKRKEAQRKLEKVEQNLLHVQSIVEEVERRLRSVKVAAGKARSYQEYSARLNELRLTYSLQEYHQLYRQVAELEQDREETQFRLDDAAANLAHQQNLLATRRQELESLTHRRQSAEFDLVQTRAQIQSAEQKQQFAREQLVHIAEQASAYEQERQSSQQRLAEVTRQLEVEAANLRQLTGELDRQRSLIEQRQGEFKQGQLRINSIAEEIERHKAAALELMRAVAQVSSRLGAIEIERRNIAQQQERLAERRRAVVEQTGALAAQQAELGHRIEQLTARMHAEQAALEDRRQEASRLSAELRETGEALAAEREHRSALVSRQKLLQDLESRREGVSEGVKSVLRQRETGFPFIRGLVADLLRVDVEHARIVEAALDGRDQWLVAEDADSVVNACESLTRLEGRVNIVCRPRGGAPPGEPFRFGPVQGLLSLPESPGRGLPGGVDCLYDWNRHGVRVRLVVDLVRADPADQPLVRHLLGNTVVVDDMATALELHRSGPPDTRYVTPAGEVLEADGTLKTGPLAGVMGLLSRRSELESLARQIQQVDQRIAELSAELARGNDVARRLEEEQNALRQGIHQLHTQKVELSSQQATLADRLASLRREQPLLEKELNALIEQQGRLKDEDQQLEEQRAALDAEQSRRQEQIGQLQSQQVQLGESIKHWAEELTAARVSLGQVQEKQIACAQAVERHSAGRQELTQQIERIARSIESLETQRAAVEAEIASAGTAERQLRGRAKAVAESVEQLTAQAAAMLESVNRLVATVESLRGEHGELEQRLHQIELRLGEHRVRVDSLVQRTRDDLGLDLPARYVQAQEQYQAALAEDAGAVSPFEGNEQHWELVAAEIRELRERIARLGNVNLDSLSELAELEQRSQFYATQIGDLTTSRQQLTELIDEINRESGIRFEQTFNAVREHFQAMFRKLFGGGSADIFLELEVPDTEAMKEQAAAMAAAGEKGPVPVMKKLVDPLEAGIEILARPPGKKPVTISQLSGGEKAMTCIALLLGIFKSKPSPFCILDEVDAPLDEANNVRFGQIVQEFLNTSQFIIITHHKRTMQICDVLYGVTQQEQGVSKRVAVKFEQVEQGGRISAQAVREAESQSADETAAAA